MNTLLWITQIILAGVFLFTGFSKVFAYGHVVQVVEARSKGVPIGMSQGPAVLLGLVEIAGATGVLVPVDLWPPHVLLRMSCAGLALLMVAAGIYHIRRQASAAPNVSLFLLAVFVIVGRWPR
ncbi:MAG: DoxX family protein [Terracidiphilus sp.]|nr:DoxX family protein [Terracidiphilus sp.]